MNGRRVLLVIGGGIAAYKSLDLIRRLRERGFAVRCILTAGATQFVTPLAAGTLSGERVHTDLFDRESEADIGHIRLARDADAVVVAPATANLLARMAAGIADDLATTALLATTLPILVAPAMNVRMWEHPATRRNMEVLRADGVAVVGPGIGAMAEAEWGAGRLAEPGEIADALAALLSSAERSGGRAAPPTARPAGWDVSPWTGLHPLEHDGEREPPALSGRHVLVTSGPTHEPIDPVRYIANRSSGRQGHAIAAAAAALGARVTLVSGPVAIGDPPAVSVVRVETAREMLAAVEAALPADIAVFAAAVADWRAADEAGQKLKKDGGEVPPLRLALNPDILATIAGLDLGRPALVVGFAAETERVTEHARAKLARKGCDLIVANDVSEAGGAMGGDSNAVHLVTAAGVESWERRPKTEVARRLVERFAALLREREGHR